MPGDDLDIDWALKLLSLPRLIGPHPESGNPITASIGRYGPYLAHDGKYARLTSTAEVFETGMNAAVSKLADAASGAGRQRGATEPLKRFGDSPVTGKEVKLMAGRFGAYVTDGVTNATLPKTANPDEMTVEGALELLAARAAKGPPAKGKKPARKAAAPKKAAAKKAPAKKTTPKK